ncbi:MAG: N-acetylmuramoyl-L-alanine amidase [Bacteroidales bacterium]|nr:N-acetylmuramoyl-L-alanine amidase [Bacteroidales bacterium]MCF8405937.1 N-acetylmuramoyl-L-alanine amidase [Bacteroidales bacterium]
MKFKRYILLTILVIFFPLNLVTAQSAMNEDDSLLYASVSSFTNSYINGHSFRYLTGYNKRDSTKIDTIITITKENLLEIYFDNRLAFAPIREDLIGIIQDSIRFYLPEVFRNYRVELFADSIRLSEFIPNYNRSKLTAPDPERIPSNKKKKMVPIVENISKPYSISSGLKDKNIALWHSHGWYYESKLHRWEWQRARLFQTVEDIYPMSYTLQYLVPMLENAGANVFLPRERDWQINEVIVDNDASQNRSLYIENLSAESHSLPNTGFAIGNPPYIDENPFKLGTYQSFTSDKSGANTISWIPDIPESGFYAVYISYSASDENVDDANYILFHEGGVTEFSVNQQIGGSTWIYLGKFKFKEGLNPETAKLVLSSKSRKSKLKITADAVRFGGGMGNIERNGLPSHKPRYQEGARYYLQYAGFPDTLVWKLQDTVVNDYADDYQSRGEWLDYLIGAPSGPTKNRNVKGLGIPVDLSLAFHTDAGISKNDTVIGTLAIYSTKTDSSHFPSGLSKMASRDLSDIIQSQIVNDLRFKYDSSWVRRGLWDRDYSEAWRPTVPAMLLELFSHQNFLDARFGAEPQFRFDVSRAIYKGMVRFLSFQYDYDYVIQPLPVKHFQVLMDEKDGFTLSWEPQLDSLEPTAIAEKYVVYTRIGEGDFDNGQLIKNNTYSLKEIEKDQIYSFKVTAINKGGESFPSEILSACKVSNEISKVMIINGFDRIGTPAYMDQGNFAGFMDIVDQGVPDHFDIHTTGSQYDFDKNSPWLDDDSPGHGASFSDKEPFVIPGNSFDFCYVHGSAIKKAGFSFVSVSDESFIDKNPDTKNYPIIDYLAGEEKTSFYPKDENTKRFEVYPEGLLKSFDKYLKSGGSLFISGAHIGTDIKENDLSAQTDTILKFKWRTNHASRVGEFNFVDTCFNNLNDRFSFNTKYHPSVYTVEAPDAIVPSDSSGKTLLRYTENNMSAAVSYSGPYKIVAFGFPFETILNEKDREFIMLKILDFLNK